MDKYTQEFGQRVRDRRKALGMTQLDLALKMGLKSKQAICHIESGDRNLKQSQVMALAEAMNVTPAYLLGWEDTEREQINQEINDILSALPLEKKKAALGFLRLMFEDN